MEKIRGFCVACMLLGLMVSCGPNKSREEWARDSTGARADTVDTTGGGREGVLDGSEDPRSQGIQGNQTVDSSRNDTSGLNAPPKK